jgi:hypothetical protein
MIRSSKSVIGLIYFVQIFSYNFSTWLDHTLVALLDV